MERIRFKFEFLEENIYQINQVELFGRSLD